MIPAAARRLGRRALHGALAFVLPADCFLCGLPLPAAQLHGACLSCWAAIRPLRQPTCAGCAIELPRATDLRPGVGGRCGRCARTPLGLDGAVAAVAYERAARRLLLRGKLGGRPELLAQLGAQLARAVAAAEGSRSCGVVVPVPSHPWARLRRGFDPAMEIARPLARHLGLPLAGRLLRRRVRTPRAVKRLGAGERRRALEGAFAARAAVDGRAVLLVDDVLTTGATAAACARALRAAGATQVWLAAWARTPKAPYNAPL